MQEKEKIASFPLHGFRSSDLSLRPHPPAPSSLGEGETHSFQI